MNPNAGRPDPTDSEMKELFKQSERSMKIAAMLHRIAKRKPRKNALRKTHCPYCNGGVISWVEHNNGHIHAQVECGCAPNFME